MNPSLKGSKKGSFAPNSPKLASFCSAFVSSSSVRAAASLGGSAAMPW